LFSSKRLYRRNGLVKDYSISLCDNTVLYMCVLYDVHGRLTNEEARKNWEEYGNPDGPGG